MDPLIVDISALVAVVAFVVLVVFIVRLLIQASRLMEQINQQTKKFDSLFNSISNVGEICEVKTEDLKKKSLRDPENMIVEEQESISGDIADLLLASIRLFQKLKVGK